MLPESNMTFQELSDWYLGLKSVQKLRAIERVEIGLANFNKEFGNREVGSIRPLALEDYQDKREKEGMSPATIDMEVNFAKTVIIKAFDNDMIDGRPLKVFRRIKGKLKAGDNARKRTLSTEEYLRLLDKAQDYFKPVIETAYNTGMRGGEIRKLKWEHVDKEAGFFRLPAEITKEKKAKDIPINYHVKKILLEVPKFQNNDFVFTINGKSIRTGADLRNYLKTACRRAKIPYGHKVENGITFHDFRRTVKTNMLNAGIDKAYRDVILGHSLQGMDRHYISIDDDTLKEVMKRFTHWLDDQIAQAPGNLDQALDQTNLKH